MKNLFLILAVLGLSFAVKAQQDNSKYFSSMRQVSPPSGAVPVDNISAAQITEHSPAARHSAAAAKSTGCCGPYADWYDLWDDNTRISGGSLIAPAVMYSYALFPDSSIIDDYVTHSNVFIHGIGMSFDPTDSGYSLPCLGTALWHSIGTTMPPGGVPYTIDSFAMPVHYVRHNAYIDSLIIEIVVTETAAGVIDSGAYNSHFPTASAAMYPVTYDEKPRFGTIRYSPGGSWDPAPYNAAPYVNDCYFDSVFTYKQRYAIPLTGASTDTDAAGLINLDYWAHLPTLPLSPAIYIASPRTHAVSFVSFKSGGTYPFGTFASAANIAYGYAGEPNGPTTWFRQSASNAVLTPPYIGSYQAGVYADNDLKYLHNGIIDTGYYAMGLPHDILKPGFAFPTPGLSVPLVAWHVVWSGTSASCTPPPPPLNQNYTNGTAMVTAYPNPAADELNIPFELPAAAEVTVSLTNMIGQTVATKDMGSVNAGNAVFNTSMLPPGVYIYTLHAGNDRYIGRIVIAGVK